jgi:hypothetical protein
LSIPRPVVRRINRGPANAGSDTEIKENILKYLSVYHSTPKTLSTEAMADMQKLVEESFKSGVMIMTGGILPVKNGGARVRSSGGQITVDGPYTEAKELTGGFAILQAKSREEVIELTRSFLRITGDGECEIHQIEGPGGDN